MTKIVAFANQKGGVGKTVSTCNTSRAAAVQGLKVLAVDADPQGNLTTAIAGRPIRRRRGRIGRRAFCAR